MDYRRIEQALVILNSVRPSRLVAFRSRLRVLRDAGFPKVKGPGKGRRTEYGFEHLWAYQLGLELEKFGLSPSTTAKIGDSAMVLVHGYNLFERVRTSQCDVWVGIAPLDRLSKNVRFFSGSLAEVTAEVEVAGNPPIPYTPLGTVPAIFGLFNASKLTRDCENALTTTE